jgi:hypothetical protein
VPVLGLPTLPTVRLLQQVVATALWDVTRRT